MTLVDYFTSTRELAGMRRLVEDDVTDRLGRQAALVRRRRPVVTELTSRMDSRKITQSLADLERQLRPRQRQHRRHRARCASCASRPRRVRPIARHRSCGRSTCCSRRRCCRSASTSSGSA